MKRILTTAAAVASLLYLLVTYAPPAASQIGYGAAPVASDIIVGTADFTLQGDDFYVGWGASDDWQLEYVSASDQLRITDDGVAQSALFSVVAAGASGSMFDFVGTYPIADGADTLHFLDLSITNVDHATGTAIVNGLNIGDITPDAQATESAIFIGNNWDAAITIGDAQGTINFANASTGSAVLQIGGLSMIRGFGNSSASPSVELGGGITGRSNDSDLIVQIDGGRIGTANGSDIYQVLEITGFTDKSHTGTGNEVIGIDIEGITTPDADAAHYGLRVGAGWEIGLQLLGEAAISKGVVYEDFELACASYQTDDTAESLGNNENNFHDCPGSGLTIIQRNEGVQTAFAFANPTAGGVQMFNTATADIGEDVRFAKNALAGYAIVGTTGEWFVEFSITIADISAFDGNLGIGYMVPFAFAGDPDQDALNTYALFTLSDNAGDLDVECDVDGGGQANDDTGITWADAETKILRIELQTDGGSEWFVDGTQVTTTNCDSGGANDFTAADKAVPFIMGTVGAEGVDPGFVLNYIKFGEV